MLIVWPAVLSGLRAVAGLIDSRVSGGAVVGLSTPDVLAGGCHGELRQGLLGVPTSAEPAIPISRSRV